MIGEFLNQKQIEVLQGIASHAFGAQFTSVELQTTGVSFRDLE